MDTKRHVAHPRLAFLVLVSGGFVIGFSAICVKLSPVGPVATAFYRLALALPVLWAVMTIEGEGRAGGRDSGLPKGGRWLLVVPGLCFGCDITVWHYAIRYTTVANATLLGNLCPVFVTLAAWYYFKEHVSGLFLAGLALALGGTALLMSHSLQLGAGHLLGDLLSVVSALFYGGYQLAINRLRRYFSTATLMTYTCAAGLAPVLIMMLLTRESLLWGGPAFLQGLLTLLILALVCHTCGQGMVVYGMKQLPASFGSVTLLVQPVVAAVAGWLILSQILGAVELLGGLVVLVGIFLARQGSLNVPEST